LTLHRMPQEIETMHALIVLAHPSPLSFNAALARAAAATFERNGHQARITDLYAAGFEARLGRGDMTGTAPDGYFNVGREQARAYRKGTLAADIAAQIALLRRADLVMLQFPFWWYGPPAILKGWMDRVFLPGFSYGRENWFETGGLSGKKAMLSMTTSVTSEPYLPDGRFGALDVVLWPMHLSLRYVGFDVLTPFMAYDVDRSEEERLAILARLETRLSGVEAEAPLFFHSLTDFGADHRLRPRVVGRTAAQWRRAPETGS
jgi:NAD(P)H dehydrogenase (quinone)